nr:efflux RND transporter periplasmic adaptor subunit [Brucella intermedia]
MCAAYLKPLVVTGFLALATPAWGQMPGGGPPAVGVVVVRLQPMTEMTSINGRIQAIDKVEVVARVSAFLDERKFTEGQGVKVGDLLFRLEQAPFQAEVEAKRAAVAQAEAQLENANSTLARNEQLRKSGSNSQSALDNARAAQRTTQAQLHAAKAALHMAEINLGYTEIRSPVSGRIGMAAVSPGNVVSPASGVLTTVVSQDPMYVTFSLPTRKLMELREKLGDGAEVDKALRLRIVLPGGQPYEHVGKLDFFDISVAQGTDTITLRGLIPNPVRPDGSYTLFNDEFVRVLLEDATPKTVLAIPRGAVLTDQQGDYVYVVNTENIAEIRRVKLGQSTAATAAVLDGLNAGDRVVADGVQRVRPGTPVNTQLITDDLQQAADRS